MTDKERKRRRMEIEKRMRARGAGTRHGVEHNSKNLLLFRTYITVILAGAFLVVSFFQTPTAEMVCNKIKATIGYQISAEELTLVRDKAISVWKQVELPLPVFEEREPPADKRVYQPDLESSP